MHTHTHTHTRASATHHTCMHAPLDTETKASNLIQSPKPFAGQPQLSNHPINWYQVTAEHLSLASAIFPQQGEQTSHTPETLPIQTLRVAREEVRECENAAPPLICLPMGGSLKSPQCALPLGSFPQLLVGITSVLSARQMLGRRPGGLGCAELRWQVTGHDCLP